MGGQLKRLLDGSQAASNFHQQDAQAPHVGGHAIVAIGIADDGLGCRKWQCPASRLAPLIVLLRHGELEATEFHGQSGARNIVRQGQVLGLDVAVAGADDRVQMAHGVGHLADQRHNGPGAQHRPRLPTLLCGGVALAQDQKQRPCAASLCADAQAPGRVDDRQQVGEVRVSKRVHLTHQAQVIVDHGHLPERSLAGLADGHHVAIAPLGLVLGSPPRRQAHHAEEPAAQLRAQTDAADVVLVLVHVGSQARDRVEALRSQVRPRCVLDGARQLVAVLQAGGPGLDGVAEAAELRVDVAQVGLHSETQSVAHGRANDDVVHIRLAQQCRDALLRCRVDERTLCTHDWDHEHRRRNVRILAQILTQRHDSFGVFYVRRICEHQNGTGLAQ
mmetsp:Transcript_47516/g.152635  ORF Transcript_47516/g.152635 Transcript_47516/m.152635 type:complete len:389 (+) Transcript_47516:706-1872(+)